MKILHRSISFLILLAVTFLSNSAESQSSSGKVAVYSKNNKIKLIEIDRTEKYTVIANKGGWLIVTFDKPIIPAWVSRNYIRQSDEGYIVNVDNLNLRLGPSTDSLILRKVSTGEILKSISVDEGEFIKIYAPRNTEFAIKLSDINDSNSLEQQPKTVSATSAIPINSRTLPNSTQQKNDSVVLKGFIVNKGSIKFEQGLTVYEAIQAAGGIGKSAALNNVDIFRKGRLIAASLLIDSDHRLLPGDIVVVNGEKQNSNLSIVSVFGNVNLPGEYLYRDGYTVSNVVAIAGGFSNKSEAKISIIRRSKKTGSLTRIQEVKGTEKVQKGDVIDIE